MGFLCVWTLGLFTLGVCTRVSRKFVRDPPQSQFPSNSVRGDTGRLRLFPEISPLCLLYCCQDALPTEVVVKGRKNLNFIHMVKVLEELMI